MRRLHFLTSTAARVRLNKYGALFGALFAYSELKMIWMADRNAAEVAITQRNDNSQVISNEIRPVAERALQQYAEYLNSYGEYQFVWNAIEPVHYFNPTTILRAIPILMAIDASTVTDEDRAGTVAPTTQLEDPFADSPRRTSSQNQFTTPHRHRFSLPALRDPSTGGGGNNSVVMSPALARALRRDLNRRNESL